MDPPFFDDPDRAEGLAGRVQIGSPGTHDRLDPVRPGSRCEVEILRPPVEQCVANAAPHQVQLLTRLRE